VRNILFDFDGTLMDTWPGIEATFRAILRDLDLIGREEYINRRLVGMGLGKAFQELLGEGEELAVVAKKRYRELFPKLGMPYARPYKGVVPLLDTLKEKGSTLYIVTARSETVTKNMLSNHHLESYFSFVRGEKEEERSEGKAHMVTEVLEKFSLPHGRCIMVGDRRYDMEAAKANGLRAVGVTYGYGSREELADAGATEIVESIEELKEVLLGNSE